MSLNFCDLLVLGSDLSGVIAGTLLAKRGMNVLVLDDEDEAERSANVFTGFDSRAFKSLLSKLMIPESKLQVLQENEIACQVIFPRHRIDLSSSREHFSKEISREFPAEKERVEEFLGEVDALREKALDPFFGFLPLCTRKETKRFLQWLRQLPDQKTAALWQGLSPTLQTLLKLQLRFLSRGPLLEPLTLQLLLYLPPEGCTTFSLRGGTRELKKLFFEKLDYFGGLVHPLAGDTLEIQAHGREIRSVKLERLSFPTRCRFLMGNLDLKNFYQNLPRNFWSYWRKRKIENVAPLEEPYLIQFEVARDHLPRPMKENLVVIEDPAQPLSGLNTLEMNLSPVSRSNNETALLSVVYRLPAGAEPSETVFAKIHDEIEKRLRTLIPFSESSLKRVFPQQAADTGLFPETGDFPLFLKMARKRRAYPPSLLSPSPLTPFKNSVLLGPNLLEGLGMEGKILTALKGVELIWNQESKLKKT